MWVGKLNIYRSRAKPPLGCPYSCDPDLSKAGVRRSIVGQLLGRGLVSKNNQPMKCTTSKLLTCRVTNGGPVWSAFYVVSQSKIKQHQSVGVLVVCHFFDVTIVT